MTNKKYYKMFFSYTCRNLIGHIEIGKKKMMTIVLARTKVGTWKGVGSTGDRIVVLKN